MSEATTEHISRLESFEVAAMKINGVLKEVIFKKFLSIATELLGTLTTSSHEMCIGSFLYEVFGASSEEERGTLARIVQDDDTWTTRKLLFDVICSIWSKGM